MLEKNESLDELRQQRLEWVEASRKNGFEAGIKKLLSDLYPDQAHFIYELLQNAEDAEASIVKFDLQEEQLIVTHDGKRLFTYPDVESITSIGDSTKSDDVNQIGKFGVGFKAVFAYTNTPQIHSGDFNFEIRDLVCPFEIKPRERNADETVFVFPFNNVEKDAEECCKEVMHVFRHINHSVLLFLQNIEAIEWTIKGGSTGTVLRARRTDIDSNLIQISTVNPAQIDRQKDVWYLLYERQLPEHGELKCGIALKLDFQKVLQKELDRKTPLSQQMKLVSDNGRLCIFFPTEKESTGLNFYLNGPYASTIDRASIRHSDHGNQSIMNITSELWGNVLESLRDNNLLTANFLTVLPNDDDNLSPFYAKIREATYNSLKTKNLLPTQSGIYADASNLVRGPKTLTDLLSDEDVAFLSAWQGRKWVVNVMRHQRADKLLKSVGIPVWGNEELLEAVDEYFGLWADEDEKVHSNNWLIHKKHDWVRGFYLALWTAAKKESYHFIHWEIVLTEDNNLVKGKDVYFPPKEDSSHLSLQLVNRSLFVKISSEKKERLRGFLGGIGVREIGEEEELINIINKYYSPGNADSSQKQHCKHMRRFVEWAQQSGSYIMFGGYDIFLDRERNFRNASECYLDSPILKTGMAAIGELTETVPLWEEYNKIKGFADFAKRNFVLAELAITRQPIPWSHPDKQNLHEDYGQRHTHTSINQDYQIKGLEEWIGNNNLKLANLVWAKMCNAGKAVQRAHFRPNQQYQTKVAPSTLIYCLSESSWIPSKDGSFYPPKKMTKSDLLDDFVYDNRNGWLTAIGFGEEAAQATEEYKEKQQNAKNLGINIEDAELIKNNPEDFEKWKEEQKVKQSPTNFPNKPSKNLSRREKKIAEKVKNAPEKKYSEKTRTVRESRNKVDPAPWLITQYTNDDGQMFCQLCQQELSIASFKKRNSEEYFECVEIFNHDKLTIEFEAQFLALCPLCAAKYKEFIKRDEDASELLLEQLMEHDNFRISLQLGEEQAVLRFVETHYNDLHVVLWGIEEE